jgi:hypothetical protein
MQGIATLPYEVVEEEVELPLVPDNGLHTLQHAADMLADFGRHGDVYIVHAAEGETVIPLPVLNANPKMKEMIFQQMEEMGIDPEQYIVGNELNSINPATGVREFGFLSGFKKIFKKATKAVKKVVKKIKPILKVALPVLAAFAAPFLLPAAPLWLSGGLGSLAGSFIGGVRDPKQLALSFGLGAAGGAFKAKFLSGPQGSWFGSRTNPGAAFTDFGGKAGGGIANLGTAVTDAKNPLSPNTWGLESWDPRTPNETLDAITRGDPGVDSYVTESQIVKPSINQTALQKGFGQDFGSGSPQLNLGPPSLDQPTLKKPPNWLERNVWDPAPNIDGQGEGWVEGKISANRSSIQPSQDAILQETQNRIASQERIFKAPLDMAAKQDILAKVETDLSPGPLSKFWPTAALGTGMAVLGDVATKGQVLGLFSEEDTDGDGVIDQWRDNRTGQLYYENPLKYGFSSDFYGRNPYYTQEHVPTYVQNPPPPVVVAGGGEIVGPGTSTSDSIPALLSDGEFVVNAATVAGIGGGDRKEGAKKLYAMQRAYDQRVA